MTTNTTSTNQPSELLADPTQVALLRELYAYARQVKALHNTCAFVGVTGRPYGSWEHLWITDRDVVSVEDGRLTYKRNGVLRLTAEVSDLRQAVDVLVAVGVLPPAFSSASGVEAVITDREAQASSPEVAAAVAFTLEMELRAWLGPHFISDEHLRRIAGRLMGSAAWVRPAAPGCDCSATGGQGLVPTASREHADDCPAAGPARTACAGQRRTILTFDPSFVRMEPITLDGFASSEQITDAVVKALAADGYRADDLSVRFEDDGATATLMGDSSGRKIGSVTIAWPVTR